MPTTQYLLYQSTTELSQQICDNVTGHSGCGWGGLDPPGHLCPSIQCVILTIDTVVIVWELTFDS